MNKLYLSTEETIDTLDTFSNCFKILYDKQPDAIKVYIDLFVTEIIQIVPCYFLRPDNVQKLNDYLFSNSDLVAFISELHFLFFTHCSNFQQQTEKLINNLIDSLSMDGPDIEVNIIPKVVASSMPANVFKPDHISRFSLSKPDPTIKDFLINNKHFIIFLLIYLNNSKKTELIKV